jgi:hypothetical protein
MIILPNKNSMQPTVASGSGQFKGVGRWPLAPAAHAQRWARHGVASEELLMQR